jgi:phosphoribosylcarboxyaminoimidazole (NCAIR) mutase
LALRILASDDEQLAERLESYRQELIEDVSTQNHNLRGPRSNTDLPRN